MIIQIEKCNCGADIIHIFNGKESIICNTDYIATDHNIVMEKHVCPPDEELVIDVRERDDKVANYVFKNRSMELY